MLNVHNNQSSRMPFQVGITDLVMVPFNGRYLKRRTQKKEREVYMH